MSTLILQSNPAPCVQPCFKIRSMAGTSHCGLLRASQIVVWKVTKKVVARFKRVRSLRRFATAGLGLVRVHGMITSNSLVNWIQSLYCIRKRTLLQTKAWTSANTIGYSSTVCNLTPLWTFVACCLACLLCTPVRAHTLFISQTSATLSSEGN